MTSQCIESTEFLQSPCLPVHATQVNGNAYFTSVTTYQIRKMLSGLNGSISITPRPTRTEEGEIVYFASQNARRCDP